VRKYRKLITKLYILIKLFYLHFRYGSQYFMENPAPGFVTLCIGVVLSKTSSHFTHITHSQHLTTTIPFTPLTSHTPHRHEHTKP